MRAINKVILHCSATPDSFHPTDPSGLVYRSGGLVRNWYYLDIYDVRQWHVHDRNFFDVGYHYFIKRNGHIQQGRDINVEGAHCYGENRDSIGVCYAGTNYPTPNQVLALRFLAKQFEYDHGLEVFSWHCHNEFSLKSCPGFSFETLHNLLLGRISQVDITGY
jgi:hypothetical protein